MKSANQLFIEIHRHTLFDKEKGCELIREWGKQIALNYIMKCAQYCDDGFNGDMIISQCTIDLLENKL